MAQEASHRSRAAGGVAGALAVLLAAAPAVADLDDNRPDPVDAATDRALSWLAGQQHPDGTWASGYGHNCAVTSVAIMAFLAKGHVPGRGPYGAVVDRGLDAVLAAQKDNGLITTGKTSGAMYDHGISTLMLAEAVGMTAGQREQKIRDALGKAVKLIIDAQKLKRPNHPHFGGWRYQHTSRDSDISVTGWCVMALKAAKNAGAEVPVEVIDHAIGFIKRCSHRAGGFGYQPGGGPNQARTGTGILVLQIAGYHQLRKTGRDYHKEALAGGDWLLKHPLNTFNGSHFYYAVYYTAQAMFQLGDKYHEAFFPALSKLLLAHQQPDGSWPLESGSARAAGPVYSTGMTVLALSVKYRFLPIYQR